MRLSTRSRYGVRMMLELALNYGKGSTFLRDIAKNEDISEKYLSQLIIPLKARGLINSIRGAHGGYTLAKKPSDINLRDIVEILEGNLNLVSCVKDASSCKRVSFCVTRDIWTKLREKIVETLGSLTLEDLVKICKEKEKNSLMYNI